DARDVCEFFAGNGNIHERRLERRETRVERRVLEIRACVCFGGSRPPTTTRERLRVWCIRAFGCLERSENELVACVRDQYKRCRRTAEQAGRDTQVSASED